MSRTELCAYCQWTTQLFYGKMSDCERAPKTFSSTSFDGAELMVDPPKLGFGRANWSQGQTVEDLWGKQDLLARGTKVRDKHAAKNRGAE